MRSVLGQLGVMAAIAAASSTFGPPGTVYVLCDDGLAQQRRRLMAPRAPHAPRNLIDRAEEPRFYAVPSISRRRRRRLRGERKAFAWVAR